MPSIIPIVNEQNRFSFSPFLSPCLSICFAAYVQTGNKYTDFKSFKADDREKKMRKMKEKDRNW